MGPRMMAKTFVRGPIFIPYIDQRPTMNDELSLLYGEPEGDAVFFVTDAVGFAVEFHQGRDSPQTQAVAAEYAFRAAGPG